MTNRNLYRTSNTGLTECDEKRDNLSSEIKIQKPKKSAYTATSSITPGHQPEEVHLVQDPAPQAYCGLSTGTSAAAVWGHNVAPVGAWTGLGFAAHTMAPP